VHTDLLKPESVLDALSRSARRVHQLSAGSFSMTYEHEQSDDRSTKAPIALLIEDDEDCREAISETLREANYVVVEVVDAEAALRLLVEGTLQPDVILLDIRLPGMSGRELLEVLRAHDRLCRAPIVLMSAGRPCGADTELDTGWLAKPFDAQGLLAAVNEQRGVTVSRSDPSEPQHE
jgi:DNA-binding response OmpR family regulator